MEKILIVLLAINVSLLKGQPEVPDKSNSGSKHQVSYPMQNGKVTIGGGFWKDQQDKNTQISIPLLLELAEDPARGHVIRNFEIAAGIRKGQREGTKWQDAWLYKWIEAACYSLEDTPDIELERKVDEYVDLITRAQAEDGYLATQTMITNRERFEAPANHELYTMGHLITAGIVHYRITGKKELFAVAEKCADFLYKTTMGNEERFAEYPLNPSVIMALVDLFRLTENKKYVDLAEFFVNLRGNSYHPEKKRPSWGALNKTASDQNQNYKPLKIEDEVLGHSVFFTYLYCGATDVYMETGDIELLKAMERLWKDLVNTKMYVTGGIGPEHKALVTRKIDSGRRDIFIGDPIHEGISGPYNLPNATAYNETCGQIGNFMWNWRMLLATGDPKYGDIMELSIYNSILSGVELDGSGWFYTNPLSWNGPEHILLNKDAHKRYFPGRDDICCPTNLTRTVASYDSYLYSVAERTLYIHHFAANQMETNLPGYGEIRICQESNFPWEGSVRIRLEQVSGKKAAIRIRIPGWAQEAWIKINDEEGVRTEGGIYFEIVRVWEEGDVIKIEIPMTVKLLRANSKFENLTNQVAVQYGSLIYCLESIDIDNNIPISQIYIPIDSEWNLIEGSSRLKGLSLLETTAFYLPHTASEPTPYAELSKQSLQKVKIRMIPYFAWNNREEPEMRVWLPVIYSQ